MTNLKWLDLRGNPITDWTPLNELAKITKIEPNGFVFDADKTLVSINDTFTLNINALFVRDLVGWQCNIAFDINMVEAIDVSEGEFLSSDGTATFFREGQIDNDNGSITGYSVLRLNGSTINGTGTLLAIKFKPKNIGKVVFNHESCYLSNPDGEEIPSVEPQLTIEVVLEVPEEFTGPAEDVNKDGDINIFDMVLVGKYLGEPVTSENIRSDVNGDGAINILDLIAVSNNFE